ncbi:MAG TPA: DUF5947 family protein [Gemmatimonadales bacterium]|nr:DUF5947 family protein [Gemmatimonadales bacterium]
MTGRLEQLARRRRAVAPPAPAAPAAPAGGTQVGEAPNQRCELCAVPIGAEHPHLLDTTTGGLRCACRACALVLGQPAAGGGRYRLVPERRVELPDLARDDARWRDLGLPVSLAFLVRRGDAVTAIFPGALGPTDAPVAPEAWAALEAAEPAVRALEPEVEALLVNRMRGDRECWIAPIDLCYRLVALVRTQWTGLTGGDEVWTEIDRFFGELIRSEATR